MLGAICGDVLGAPYEIHPVTFKDLILLADNDRFTDDTVCTCAVAQAVLDGSHDFAGQLRRYAKSFEVPYGERFEAWIHSDHEINDSAGNGAVSRVGSIPWVAPGLAIALDWAAMSAMTSHRHPDSVTAAIAVVAAARLGIEGWDKSEALQLVGRVFGYDLSIPLEEIRPGYGFRLLAIDTAPVALRAVVEGEDFEDVLRLAISMGGDADTLAAAAGGIAEAYHPIPQEIVDHVWGRLPPAIRYLVQECRAQYAYGRAKGASYGTARVDVERVLTESHRKWIRSVRRPHHTASIRMKAGYLLGRVRESVGLA